MSHIVDPNLGVEHPLAGQDPWGINAARRAEEILAGDPAFARLEAAIVSHLQAVAPDGARVLDAGCGVGILTKHLLDRGYDAEGTEPSQGAISWAREHFPDDAKRFARVSLESFANDIEFFLDDHHGFRDLWGGSRPAFDAVVANQTIHAADQPLKFLEAARYCLKKDGYLIMTLPHPAFYIPTRKGFDSTTFEYGRPTEYTLGFTIQGGEEHPAQTTLYHRSLATYVSLLLSAGFHIDAMAEIKTRDGDALPDTLLIRARRMADQDWDQRRKQAEERAKNVLAQQGRVALQGDAS